MDGLQSASVAVLVAAIVGCSKGGWSAIGNLGVPILGLVISPLAAAGLLLPVDLVSDAFGPWACRKSFDRLALAILVPACLIGMGIGWAVVPFVDRHVARGEDIVAGLGNASKLVPDWVNGQIDLSSLEKVISLAPPAIAGGVPGKMTGAWVSERTFYKVIARVLLGVGLDLFGKAILGTDPTLALRRALVA